jgi:hypothetical protein
MTAGWAGMATVGGMEKTVDVEALLREIQRYLAVVNASRARRLEAIRRKRDRKEKG